MTYAIHEGAGWRELAYGEPIIIGDVATSYASMLAWSSQYRTARGIKVIDDDDDIPDGKVATGAPRIEDRDGKPVRVWDLEDAPAPQEPIPSEISDRQFAHILAIDGLISKEEALAWVCTGTIPTQLAEAVAQIPDDDLRFSAEMHLAGATIFMRYNQLTELFGQILGRTPDQIDDLWRRAALL